MIWYNYQLHMYILCMFKILIYNGHSYTYRNHPSIGCWTYWHRFFISTLPSVPPSRRRLQWEKYQNMVTLLKHNSDICLIVGCKYITSMKISLPDGVEAIGMTYSSLPWLISPYLLLATYLEFLGADLHPIRIAQSERGSRLSICIGVHWNDLSVLPYMYVCNKWGI